jgi:hypothetical protein
MLHCTVFGARCNFEKFWSGGSLFVFHPPMALVSLNPQLPVKVRDER